MDFSVIILNFNTKKITDDCLESIFRNCDLKNSEVILVDNNSSDGSVDFFREKYQSKISLIVNKKNYGFGKGNNIGARVAKGKYLLFLNSDTLIASDIFQKAKNVFDGRTEVAVLAPRLILSNGKMQNYAFGSFPNFFRIILSKFKKTKKFSNSFFFCDWISGAAMFAKSDIFRKVQGFDEDYFMYFEDIDLCKRIKNLDYKVAVEPAMEIRHLVAASSGDKSHLKDLYFFSQDLFFQKHYGYWQVYLLKMWRSPYRFYLKYKYALLHHLQEKTK